MNSIAFRHRATLVAMIVVKFGGTSVGAVPQIDRAARVVESMRQSQPVVVVSAMAGVTDALLQAGEAAVAGQVRQRDDKLWESAASMIRLSMNCSKTGAPRLQCKRRNGRFGKKFRKSSPEFRCCAK